MIEQGIYFALGSIVTALLALLFAPVFWRRALRLTRQRLALQVPLSMQEILAQRDQIRADFAVERVRMEQAIEAVQATKAGDMAEIGRRSMEAAKLNREVVELREVKESQRGEIDRLTREIAEAGAEVGALHLAYYNHAGGDDRWSDQLEASLAENARLRDEIDSHRTTISALSTRSMGLEMRLTDGERARAKSVNEAEAGLRARLETAMGHVARHEAANLSVRRELDSAKIHIRQLEEALNAARAKDADGTKRAPSADSKRDAASAERLELLSAENAALQGALAAARRNDSGADSPDDDAGLRATIHDLGVAVAKLTRQARERDSLGGDVPLRSRNEDVSRPLGVA